MEQYKFPYRGNQYTVTRNGIDQWDTIEVKFPNNTNTYLYEINQLLNIDKVNKLIMVRYRKYIIDVDGRTLVDEAGLEFNPTRQETFPYFYNMLIGAATIGSTFDKMMLDGLLEFLGVVNGIFGADGNFYQPITFDTEVSAEPAPEEPIGEEPIGEERVPTFTISVQVVDGAPEPYTYRILELGLVQDAPVFTGIPQGKYTVMVESPASMPALKTLTL